MDAEGVNRELQRLAREHHGRDTQALQVLYAIEGFLRRLSASDYRERMVLKGGMLLAVLDARRMTRDADLSAHGIPNDEGSIAGIVAAIASTALVEPDGVTFDTAGVSTEPMRESATYRGVRAKLPATIGVARVVVTLDLSFGEPGDIEEIRYPEILGGAGIPLRAYPLERTLAEKITTIMVEPEDDAMGMSRTDPADDRESTQETLAVLSDPLVMEQIRASEQALAAGEPGASLADLQAQLEHRLRDA